MTSRDGREVSDAVRQVWDDLRERAGVPDALPFKYLRKFLADWMTRNEGRRWGRWRSPTAARPSSPGTTRQAGHATTPAATADAGRLNSKNYFSRAATLITWRHGCRKAAEKSKGSTRVGREPKGRSASSRC